MNPKSESLINQIFFEKYKVIKKIGQGSFGRIYTCEDITTNELFAMKVEQNIFQNNVLETESKYLSYLKGHGIPEMKYYGNSGKYNILIETLLDKSLENLFSESHGNFNLKDISMIGIQVLDRLEYIHNKNVIHRDIKPDNFVIGKNKDKKTIYLIDFGLAKKYRNPLNHEHIPFRMTKRLTGTARYASINALKGGEQSRKDDLESLVYMLLFFLRGSLPWQGVPGMTKGDKYKKIYYMKKNIGAEKLFENLPNEYKEIYLYVKQLEFEQDPDYNYCRKLLINVIEKNCGESNDNFFTWCKELNVLNKNFFGSNNLFGNNFSNNDESGKTMKSTKIVNMCNSNILLDKINIKKIKKISVTFIDTKKKSKNKIMNCAYNFSMEKKRNKSFILNNFCCIDKINNDDNKDIEDTQKNKEIIVTSGSKSKSNEEYSIEGEIEKKKKKIDKKKSKNNNINNNSNVLNYKNKINILSLTKINKKKEGQLININKFNRNLIRTKTNRDLFNFAKKNFNIIINNQLCQRTSRYIVPKNRSNESKSKSKSGIKVKQKNKTNISNIIYKDYFNNSPKKIRKTRNKIISVFNTHTNIRNKNKSKIKHSIKIQDKSRNNNEDKSNKKISILLEDYIGSKNNNISKHQYNTSRTNNIKNYLKNMQTYRQRYTNISSYLKNNKTKIINNKDKYNISNTNNEIKTSRQKIVKSNNSSKNKSKSRNKSNNNGRSRNEPKKYNSLTKKNSKFFSISNKLLKIQKIFSGNRKKNIIININKCYKKRKKKNNLQKSDTYFNRISRKKTNKSNINESRNNTINIESIVFVGDNSNYNNNNNNNNQYSFKSLNKNNTKIKNIIYTPKNGFAKKNSNYNEKNNFLKKFKISILCSNKKNKTNNNSIKKHSNSRIKKRLVEDKKNINYNNISLKLSENRFKKNNKNNSNNIIYNFNNKKNGPLSFNNLITNMRAKRNININNNIFCNNSLIEKKYFIQSSFNSSDSNYILNNINNNNIIVNNYNSSNNNSTSHISKKMINSYTINHQNIFSDEINENSYNNFGGLCNNSNSIFKDFIVRSNKNCNKKECNSRQNIMKFIKKFQKNNVIIKDNVQKSKNKKKFFN